MRGVAFRSLQLVQKKVEVCVMCIVQPSTPSTKKKRKEIIKLLIQYLKGTFHHAPDTRSSKAARHSRLQSKCTYRLRKIVKLLSTWFNIQMKIDFPHGFFLTCFYYQHFIQCLHEMRKQQLYGIQSDHPKSVQTWTHNPERIIPYPL